MLTDDFTAYAGRIKVKFTTAQKGDDLKRMVSETISHIALECVEAGTTLIGHIKCIAEVESGKYLACSVVTHDGAATCRGELTDGSKSLSLVLNVLLYGLDKEKVEAIVIRVAQEELAKHGGHVGLEDLEYHDPSHVCEDGHEHHEGQHEEEHGRHQ
jgi:hypothetical protein